MLRALSGLVLAAVLGAGCSSSPGASTGGDASLDAIPPTHDAAMEGDRAEAPDAGDASTLDTGDASDANDTAACVASDASKPQCLAGTPCHCDDVGSHDAPAICVGGAWQCPAGYTRFEDCGGVPPGPSCTADGGIVHDAGDGG